MSDIKLFRIGEDAVAELPGRSVALEKSLQTLIEKNLEALLGVRFLDSEHTTSEDYRGRIDTLGLDENHFPVIIEYKRALNQNVINQGLYYLDWMMKHKAAFELLVRNRFGRDEAAKIEWSSPRLLCIAGDFTKYDVNAVEQIGRNIDLIRYRQYGSDLLLFELVNATSAEPMTKEGGKRASETISHYLQTADRGLSDRFEHLEAFLLSLGDDVHKKVLKRYIAFKRLKNFACVQVHPQARKLVVFTKVDPVSIDLEPGFTRDVREIGHYGTGDLEITISSDDDFDRAKDLLISSYETS